MAINHSCHLPSGLYETDCDKHFMCSISITVHSNSLEKSKVQRSSRQGGEPWYSGLNYVPPPPTKGNAQVLVPGTCERDLICDGVFADVLRLR